MIQCTFAKISHVWNLLVLCLLANGERAAILHSVSVTRPVPLEIALELDWLMFCVAGLGQTQHFVSLLGAYNVDCDCLNVGRPTCWQLGCILMQYILTSGTCIMPYRQFCRLDYVGISLLDSLWRGQWFMIISNVGTSSHGLLDGYIDGELTK